MDSWTDSIRVQQTNSVPPACSASWYSVAGRGTVELSAMGEEGEWWVNRALVQGSESARSQGIGSRLLKAALEKAVSLGARIVRVSPGGYNADPDRQIRFYERNGFVRSSVEPDVWEWVPEAPCEG